MDFEWGDAKAEANAQKQSVSFTEADYEDGNFP